WSAFSAACWAASGWGSGPGVTMDSSSATACAAPIGLRGGGTCVTLAGRGSGVPGAPCAPGAPASTALALGAASGFLGCCLLGGGFLRGGFLGCRLLRGDAALGLGAGRFD